MSLRGTHVPHGEVRRPLPGDRIIGEAANIASKPVAPDRRESVCLVAAHDPDVPLVRALSGALAALDGLTLRAGRIGELKAALDAVPDIVLIPLESGGLARAVQSCQEVLATWPASCIVVLGESMTRDVIEALIAAGAFDFISWPGSSDEVVVRVRRALGDISVPLPNAVRAPNSRLRAMIGNSPDFARLVAKVPAMAGCNAGVLILGETGTGKEVFAQAIHYLSARAAKPWIPVNCGAIPLELVESELFGHVRGAYTNAHAQREGLVAEAEGGTLFLDDVDCLPLAAQTKLLRFLQEREYRPVGSNTVRRADVRIVAASNRDLAVLSARGDFRQDLYFRIHVLSITLPPLRDRRADIEPLARHFAAAFARQFDRRITALSPRALQKLLMHDWPGNVRELQHVIERAVLMSPGPALSADDIELSTPIEVPAASESFQDAKARVVERFERSYIEHLLATCDGNVTHAALAAKKNRRAFFELMRKHRIEPERFRAGK